MVEISCLLITRMLAVILKARRGYSDEISSQLHQKVRPSRLTSGPEWNLGMRPPLQRYLPRF